MINDSTVTGNGSIAIITSNTVGGTYSYIWTNGMIGDSISNLFPGTYTCVVTDPNGCSAMITVNIAGVVNVDKYEFVNVLELFPNPTSDYLNVNLELTEAMDLQMKVFDISGRLLQTHQKDASNVHQMNVDMSNYANGMYFIMLQIGNEINSGLLHPSGHISNNYQKFKELMNMGITAVRANSTETEIILHFAGIEGSDWFFNQVNTLDYDIIGLSYYPIWHGKSLNNLKTKMQNLSETHNKKIIIAETAYPFTLEWNDWTNNIVGLDEQLILPEYPATIEGQRKFINQIKTLTKELENGIGLCYWGAELIAWKENQSTDASPWENQALFNFDNKALPVLREFKSE